MVGIDIVFIPYKGTGAMLPDVLGGRVQLAIDNILVLTPHIKLGALNAIVAAATFVVFYLVGLLSDKQDKRRLIGLANIMYFFGWCGRLFADSFGSVVLIDDNIASQWGPRIVNFVRALSAAVRKTGLDIGETRKLLRTSPSSRRRRPPFPSSWRRPWSRPASPAAPRASSWP